MARRLITILALLTPLSGCPDAVLPDADLGDDDGQADDDDGQPGDDDDDDLPPSGPPYVEGCEQVTSQSAWCFTLDGFDLRVVGLDDGVLCDVAPTGLPGAASSLALVDGRAVACDATDGLGALDLGSGVTTRQLWPWGRCDAVADLGTGVVAMDAGWERVRTWDSVDDLLAGLDGQVIPVQPYATRMAAGEAVLVTAWHIGGAVELWRLPGGESLGELDLAGYDGTIRGLDVLPGDETLAIIDDDANIRLFDLATGAATGTASTWGGWLHGLSCWPSGNGEQDDDPSPIDDDDIDEGPGQPPLLPAACDPVTGQTSWCLTVDIVEARLRAVGLDDGATCEADTTVGRPEGHIVTSPGHLAWCANDQFWQADLSSATARATPAPGGCAGLALVQGELVSVAGDGAPTFRGFASAEHLLAGDPSWTATPDAEMPVGIVGWTDLLYTLEGFMGKDVWEREVSSMLPQAAWEITVAPDIGWATLPNGDLVLLDGWSDVSVHERSTGFRRGEWSTGLGNTSWGGLACF